MVDTLGKKHRSWVMSRIRSDNTKPELVMRSLLHRAGFRYSLQRKLPGKPDMVFPKYGSVLFVHGCFWHWHQDAGCKISKVPKSNKAFWRNKLKATAVRDHLKELELRELGWRVMTVWECEVLGQPGRTLARVVEWLRQGQHNSGDACLGSDAGLKQALAAVESRHQHILRKRTGSRRYVEYENA